MEAGKKTGPMQEERKVITVLAGGVVVWVLIMGVLLGRKASATEG